MPTVDELVKQLREKSKSGYKGSVKATKAMNKTAKPLVATLLGAEIKCPVCGSLNHVKNGEGRFKCKDCGKKYRATSNTIFQGYDFTPEEWFSILDCVISGKYFNAYTGTVKYSMSSKKAWLLKMKILSAFERMPQPKLSGIVQIDGTYYRESQKASRDLKSFVAGNDTRLPRLKHEASVCGIKGQEFVCCICGADNSNHRFAKCIGYGQPDYETLEKCLDEYLLSPLYICTDNLSLYEEYCDNRSLPHFVEPSTFKREKYFRGFVEQNTKYHPAPLTTKEIEKNERILEEMFKDRSGPHIRNSGKMKYKDFKLISSNYSSNTFGLFYVNQFHGDIKELAKGNNCVSSQYLQGYLSMMVYCHNWRVDHGHPVGSQLDDYEIIFKDVVKYYDDDYFKNTFLKDIRADVKVEGRNNAAKRSTVNKARKSITVVNQDLFDDSNISDAPNIFDKYKCFSQMNAHRINYLCDYFKIDRRNINKTAKCDLLAKLPNADEIIFREIYLMYYATTEEVLDAVNEGFFENKNKKRGRPKNEILKLNLSAVRVKELQEKKKIVFDVETTGLYSLDEILSLSIINGNGDVLFDEMFKPKHRKSWDTAEKVNNITPETVKNCKSFSYYKDMIQKIFDNAELLIAYNNPFDIGFLQRAGIEFKDQEQFDVMKEFNNLKNDGHRHKLKSCAKHYKFNWENAPHTSLGDVQATLWCFNEMIK